MKNIWNLIQNNKIAQWDEQINKTEKIGDTIINNITL